MTRKQLLNLICPNDYINNCRFIDCDYCNVKLNELLDEYDKHVIEQYKDIHDSVANEMYCKGKADTNLKDTIKDIHDNVAKEMYCKGIDDLCNEISTYRMYDEYGNVLDVLEIAKRLKAGGKNEPRRIS